MDAQQIQSRINEIVNRLKATTPGKWHVSEMDDSLFMNCVAITTDPKADGADLPYDDPDGTIRDSIVATTLIQAGIDHTKPFVVVDVDEFDFDDSSKGGRWNQDAEFIANAKDDIVFLLGVIKALQS